MILRAISTCSILYGLKLRDHFFWKFHVKRVAVMFFFLHCYEVKCRARSLSFVPAV